MNHDIKNMYHKFQHVTNHLKSQFHRKLLHHKNDDIRNHTIS